MVVMEVEDSVWCSFLQSETALGLSIEDWSRARVRDDEEENFQ